MIGPIPSAPECLFHYYLESTSTTPGRDAQLSYCLYVSRDICSIFMRIQAVIAILGMFVWLIIFSGGNFDNNTGKDTFSNNTTVSPSTFDAEEESTFLCTTVTCQLLVSYLGGLCVLLIGLGLYGSFVLCVHGCSITNSVEAISDHVFRDSSEAIATSTSHSRPQSSTMNRDGSGQWQSSSSSSSSPVQGSRHPYRRRRSTGGYYCYGNDPCCHNIWYCTDCYCPSHTHHVSSGECDGECAGDCCCCCPKGCGSSSSSSGNNDGAPILLIILAVVGIILATIGLILGSIITVIAIQRILQQHLWILQKQRLVKHFPVRDLSDVEEDMLLVLEKGHNSSDVDSGLPPAMPIPEKDRDHLKKLKLLE